MHREGEKCLSLLLNIYVRHVLFPGERESEYAGERREKERRHIHYYYDGTRSGRTDGGKGFLISRVRDKLLLMSDEGKEAIFVKSLDEEKKRGSFCLKYIELSSPYNRAE